MFPENPNILHANSFLVQITRAEKLAFFAQRVNLPGMTVNNPKQGNPYHSIPTAGDSVDWENLQISFAIDEELRNWEEIFNWISGITYPRDFTQFVDQAQDPTGPNPGSEENMYAQITVIVMNNQKNPICEFIFEDCLPMSLDGPVLDITQTSVEPLIATLTLEFSAYRMRRSGQV